HGAAGKTTLADLMLFKSGEATRAGSVDDGSSLLDTDDDEKERKSSVSSSMIHFEHKERGINLIDTPGFPDFIGQVFGPLRVVETAVVVVNAGAGIEVNTRRTFGLAGDAGIGRMVVVNKCDMENIVYDELLATIQDAFGSTCVPLNVPVGFGTDFSGVVSTLSVPDSVPEGVQADPNELNQAVMDAIVEADEDLMERYLEGESLNADEIGGGIAKAIAEGTLIPVLHISAKSDIGVAELMDALATCALPPTAVERKVIDGDGAESVLDQKTDGPLVAQVFKTRIDPFVAKMNFLRIFSGTLTKDSSVRRDDKLVKLGQLLTVQGGTNEQVDEAAAGSIVAVVKMEELVVNDCLTRDADGLGMAEIMFPTPMIGLAVEPKSRADQQKISGALQKIQEEDQTFRIYRDQQTKEMVMQGMSDLHLQIAQDRMARRDKVEVVTRQPKIPYRETVSGSAEGSYRHKKQSGGSGQFAEVHFRVAAVPHEIDPDEFFTKARFESMRNFHYDSDLNYAFVDRVTGGTVPNNFIPAVEKGIRERMQQGVLAGYQVQDVSCELYFGKDHPVDSNETAFKTAASMCFRDVFMNAKPTLLEPIVQVEISVPDDKLGDITSDLNSRRGRVEGMDGLAGGFQVIHAKAPLAEFMTYARALSSMTGGQGSFSMELSHYEMVPPNEQSKIVAASKREDKAEE
ncbi:MAG: elongation factor G, partial [Planctomycetaceae bacterium]